HNTCDAPAARIPGASTSVLKPMTKNLHHVQKETVPRHAGKEEMLAKTRLCRLQLVNVSTSDSGIMKVTAALPSSVSRSRS
ncbi:hypothetical protein LSAT2_011070, partial [Lamellibrachia satsuma]